MCRDIGSLYYRHSSEAHRGLIADLIDRLLPAGRQLTTNAHPLVEMTVMVRPMSGMHALAERMRAMLEAAGSP